MENNKKTIQEKILEKIKSGQVRMRPRWQFVLRALLFAVVTAIAAIIILFLISFVFFVLRQNGLIFAPGFGPRGWFAFLRSLPWALVGLTLLFIALLEILVQRYSFSYRKPYAYSLIGLVAIVLLGGFAIAQTSLHRNFFNSARRFREPLPFVGGLYRGFGLERFEDIRRGVIVDVGDRSFIIRDFSGETSTVAISSSTGLMVGDRFSPGDPVVVFGDRDASGTIEAEGIRRLPGGPDTDDR